MSTIVTRAGKGSPLTHNEVDANFNNLNNDKYQSGDSPTFVTVNATTVDATNLEVTNVKAKDGTAALSIADSTGKVTVSTELAVDNINVSGNAITSTNANGNIDLTPNGTGEVNITKADIDSGTIDGTTIGGSSAAAGTFTSLTNSGNLTFSSTGQRITGDTVNATASNRLAFQNSTPNSTTSLNVIPNGTTTNTLLSLEGDSAYANGPFVQIANNPQSSNEARITSGIRGTASYMPLTIYTGGSERMRLDTSGNLGIGTASPVSKLSVGGNPPSSGVLAGVSAADGISLALSDNTNNSLYVKHVASGAATFGTDSGGQLAFATNGFTERMRIDSSGNVLVGTAALATGLSGFAQIEASGTTGGIIINSATNNIGRLIFTNANTGGGEGLIRYDGSNTSMQFYTNAGERMRITSGGEVYIAGTTDQGAYNLQCNGTGVWGAGAYVNGSDARLKDNIQSLDSGLDVIKAMRPVTFQYKQEYSKDQSVQPGFIAQELQEAMAGKPYLEGVVQEGPNHLNVAYQNIIPILVKAMQEQQDQIKALQDKIAALEAK